MSNKTGIEWTDATWNPIRGCSRVSEGCRNCYAETVANRFCGPGSPYEGVVQIGADGKGNGKWNGQIKFVEKHLLDPLRWKAGRSIFVNSMSDLFHENVTDAMLDRIFAVMALCPQHTFQVLTKRPERMLAYLNGSWQSRLIPYLEKWQKRPEGWGILLETVNGVLPNVHLGVSVENHKAADERIPLLLQTPAAVRFLSCEPLLGEVDLRDVKRPLKVGTFDALLRSTIDGRSSAHLDWVIVGGESGPGARPMHPDWARSLRDQCVAAGVPFFFKQWGEWHPGTQKLPKVEDAIRNAWVEPKHCKWLQPDGMAKDVGNGNMRPGDELMVRVGKKAAGALLQGA